MRMAIATGVAEDVQVRQGNQFNTQQPSSYSLDAPLIVAACYTGHVLLPMHELALVSITCSAFHVWQAAVTAHDMLISTLIKAVSVPAE